MQNLGFVDSKFRLAILAAKRAKQLISGSKQRVDAKAENPLTIALAEILQGKIDFDIIMMSDAELSAEILGGEMAVSEEAEFDDVDDMDSEDEIEETEESDDEDLPDEEEEAEEETPEEEVD